MKGYIFDLDGTIYLDDEMIDGANIAINDLKKRNDQVVFLTNKSIASRSDYVKKLQNLGIEVELSEVINSNYITAHYLKSVMNARDTVYVIGEEPLFEELENAEINLAEDPTTATYVVLGWDRDFHYDKLNNAFQAWRNGAKILATNPDRTCPVADGEIPDCGAMIGALEGATGEKVEIITGKPSAMMAEYVLDNVLGMRPEDCYMIGDRLETDIKMANEAGMISVLVMTGITNQTMLDESSHKPRIVLESVRDIVKI